MIEFGPYRPVHSQAGAGSQSRAAARVIAVSVMLALSQGCAFLPRSAPSAGKIIRSDSKLAHLVVRIDHNTVRNQESVSDPAFPESACALEPLDPAVVGVGDRMTVLIWEKTPKGILSQEGGLSELGTIEVDRNGNVYVPFAGSIHAQGRYLDDLREDIRALLKVKMLDPEVDVRAIERVSKRVAVQGAVGKPDSYTITKDTTRLLPMIARAGGPAASPELVEISVRRGDQLLRSALSRVQADAEQNIALRPGDIIMVTELGPSVSVLGVAGRPGSVRLPATKTSLLDALALAGGLRDDLASLKGVFLFRNAQAPGGADPAGASTAGSRRPPVIYHLDFRKPESVFLAGMFQVRDGDAVVMSSAPAAQLRKFFAIFTGAARSLPAMP
jgi:polysaccharide export outer membrane protein